MIDINKKYRTRDGRPVELLTTNARGAWPVIGYIEGDEQLRRWSLGGYPKRPHATHIALDIVEVKPKRVMWFNVYHGGEVHAHGSREDADGWSGDNRVACLKIEFEEGEGL